MSTRQLRTHSLRAEAPATQASAAQAPATQALAIRAEPTAAGSGAARFAPSARFAPPAQLAPVTRFAPVTQLALAAQVPPAPVSRLRLTRRGRAVFTTLAAIPLVLAALFMALNGGMATATDASGAPLEYVTVSGGESLWVVAQQIAPSEDPREVIAQVLRFNELTSPDVVAGQRLAVPTQYSN